MAKQLQLRRGTTEENDAFTGASGELSVDLNKKTVRVHDGSTVGGTELARISDIEESLTDYAKKSDYLSLAGGTMSGEITIPKGVEYSVNIGGGKIYAATVSNVDYTYITSKGDNSGSGSWLYLGTNGVVSIHVKSATAEKSIGLYNTGRFTWDGLDASSFSMPSGTTTALTLGASANTYTAPADGWYRIDKTSSATGQYLFVSTDAGYQQTFYANASGNRLRMTVPVKRGDVLTVTYTLGGTTNDFRFIYANADAWRK